MTRGSGIGSDGVRRGTNYIHRAKLAAMRDAVPRQIVAAAAQQARCAAGAHDVTVARPRYVTYVRGRKVEPGTQYCRYCSTILAGDRVGADPATWTDS